MGRKISSTIEIITENCQMKHKKRHRKESHGDPSVKPHSHHYKSEAKSDKNRFFHGVQNKNQGVNQTVNVDVKIEQEDCFSSMFSAIGKCFGKG